MDDLRVRQERVFIRTEEHGASRAASSEQLPAIEGKDICPLDRFGCETRFRLVERPVVWRIFPRRWRPTPGPAAEIAKARRVHLLGLPASFATPRPPGARLPPVEAVADTQPFGPALPQRCVV